MSENVAEKGPLDGPVFSAPQHVLEVGFGMENAQNQHIAQGGVQLHLPKSPGTPIVDDNMRMVTAPPKGGGDMSQKFGQEVQVVCQWTFNRQRRSSSGIPWKKCGFLLDLQVKRHFCQFLWLQKPFLT